MENPTSARAEAAEPRLFKFLNHEDAHFLLGNQISLKFGRLRYYRLLEACTLDNRIGDIREGLAVTEAKSQVIIREGEDEDLRYALAGVVRADAGTIEIGQMRIRSEKDCFVLSLGAGCFENLSNEFAQSGPAAYDAALELRSIGQLIDAIQGSTYDGRPIKDRFDIEHGLVRYGKHEPADFHVVRRIQSGDPFFKEKALYENQSEFRIVLIPKFAIPDLDHVFISLEGESEFFAQVGITGSTRVSCDVTQKIVDFEEVLTRCFQQWAGRERIKNSSQSEKDRENREFEPIRREMIEAYWLNRHVNKSSMIDDAIVRGFEPVMFNARFATFAMGIGIYIVPPT